MAAPPKDPRADVIETTAVAVRPQAASVQRQQDGALAPGAPPAGPSVPVRRALPLMLQASSQAWGSVVDALLCDLREVGEDMERLSWLSVSQSLLEREHAFQAAEQHLQWWDGFLATLPFPRLRSDRMARDLQRIKALRHRARLLARDAALAEHRARVQEALDGQALDGPEEERLFAIQDDPERTEWWADLAAHEAAALATVPLPPRTAPIDAQDLDPRAPDNCAGAAWAMRQHPDLAPRAQMLDQRLSALLQSELGMGRKLADPHAAVMTDMFWVALRRALDTGSHHLASSIKMAGTVGHAPVQEQFTRELLQSWLAYLEALPATEPRRGLIDRVPFLGRLLGRSEAPAIAAAPAARQIGRDEPE